MFENYRVFETELAGRPLVVETGKIAQLANGAAFVRYGDTVVNVAVTASEKPREGVDFFPLSVDFEEKLYSVGIRPNPLREQPGHVRIPAVLHHSAGAFRRHEVPLPSAGKCPPSPEFRDVHQVHPSQHQSEHTRAIPCCQ